MPRLSSRIEDIKDRYDVVVIGSGYGAAITASRLARAGRRVCVLERGRELQPGEFPDTLPEATAEMQADTPEGRVGRKTGLYDFRVNRSISVFKGCGLGGTSLVNANVSVRADPRVFQDARWPRGLRDDLAGLEEGYRQAELMLKPTPLPAAVKPLKTAALEQSAGKMGARFSRLPINVTFDEPAGGTNHVGVEQHACNMCGDCVTGCNHRAKNTVLMNYLPDAHNFGAEIFTEVDVRRVARNPAGQGWQVLYRVLGAGREGYDPPEETVEADLVVVAAGSLGSTEILLRSKAAGLPLSDRVGERFTGNGDVLGFGYNCDQRINPVGWGHRQKKDMSPPEVGPCITGVIDLRDANQPLADGMIIEEGSLPGALAPLLPNAFAGAAKAFGRDTDSGPVDFVRERTRELASLTLGSYQGQGAVQNSQVYLVMTHDDGAGRMKLEQDRLRIDWPGVGDQPIFRKVDERLTAVTAALGGTAVRDPLWSNLFKDSLLTVHPLGGCVMADDAAGGVVDHKGRVFAGANGAAVHDGLYVSDGAVIPRPLGVNPLLTISAVAERTAALIAKDHGWPLSYALPSRPQAPPAPLPTGLEFTERMTGFVSRRVLDDYGRAEADGRAGNSPFEFVLTIVGQDVERMIADPAYEAHALGTVKAPALSAAPLTVTEGRWTALAPDPERAGARLMRYQMRLTDDQGRRYFCAGFKKVTHDRALDLWPDTTTLYLTIHQGDDGTAPVLARGILHIGPEDFARLLQTMKAVNAPSKAAGVAAVARFGRAFSGGLFDVYGGVFARQTVFDPQAPPRKKRPLRVPPPRLYPLSAKDGTALRLTRYQAGKRGPVLLGHGLGVSSLIFSIDTIETNLLEYLCAHGYDVWLLDYRSSIELPAAAQQYSADDVANFDWPAAVAAVQKETGAKGIQVVAHCFGATTFTMSMLAGLEGVRSSVISQISTRIVTPKATKLKTGLHVPDFLDKLGVKSLTAYVDKNANWQDRLFDATLKLYPIELDERCDSLVCRRITFLYAPLYEHSQLNAATHAALHEMFGLATVRAFEHLGRLSNTGHLVGFDGGEIYMPHLDRLAIPTTFIHGANNGCFLPESTRLTYEELRKHNDPRLYTRHEIPSYGHIDCIFGQRAAEDVYPYIVEHLDAT